MTSGRRAEHAVLRHLVECFRSALLVLYKLVMVNKLYELPLVVSEMCKGCQVPPASEGITASLCTSCLL